VADGAEFDTAPPAKERSPGAKFVLMLLIGFLLTIPLLASWALIYDRQTQNETARASIVSGWGGTQRLAGPMLVIPYDAIETEQTEEGGKTVTRTRQVERNLFLAPVAAEIATSLSPDVRRRSIYEAVVYEAQNKGTARFQLPEDFIRFGVAQEALKFERAELRFGLSDPRGLYGAPPLATVDGMKKPLQPGNGLADTAGAGFFSWIDASKLVNGGAIAVNFSYAFRGNGWISQMPQAGDLNWSVTSKWPHPSFQGGFLPTTHTVSEKGFTARYRIGNLATGKALVATMDGGGREAVPASKNYDGSSFGNYETSADALEARVDLIQPVDFYDQVSRATKYGFLFIGFTFVAFLMFDIIVGIRISSVQYILVGAALVLFFVLLLAFAEIIGFTPAYLLAAGSIIGLITAYAAAMLGSWRRAGMIGGMLAALYGAIYILLNLEAYSLLIGSLLIFAALAGVMYLTRNLDWSVAAKRTRKAAAA
ncbi:MAG: cell envelope integrity protein CreD, partial [Parasphingorhabdus sp.]|nr:cell envelope integrity protein CreD [Parasphingorhabdus sp.]